MLQKAINKKKNFIPESSVIHTIKTAKKEKFKQVTQNSSETSLGSSS